MKALFAIGSIMVLVFFVICTMAYCEVEIDESQVAVSFLQDGGVNSIGLLAGTPLDAINGFAYGDWQRFTNEGIVLTDSTVLYLEGGVPIPFIGGKLQGYLKGEKDDGRIEGWRRDYGYFWRTPSVEVFGLHIDGGMGNFARVEIPEIDIEADTSFNWRAFLQVQHPSGISVLFETTSALNLKNPDFKVKPFTSVEIGDGLNFDFALEILREDGVTHRSTIMGFKKSW